MKKVLWMAVLAVSLWSAAMAQEPPDQWREVASYRGRATTLIAAGVPAILAGVVGLCVLSDWNDQIGDINEAIRAARDAHAPRETIQALETQRKSAEDRRVKFGLVGYGGLAVGSAMIIAGLMNWNAAVQHNQVAVHPAVKPNGDLALCMKVRF